MSSETDPARTAVGDGREPVHAIVARYIDRLNRGETIDPLEVVTESPDDAEEVLEQLSAFVGLRKGGGVEKPLGVLGDYQLRRQVGRGGMGVVYEAWQGSLERRVALKVLPAGIAADTRSVTRFVREARVAGKLHHPNIVSV